MTTRAPQLGRGLVKLSATANFKSLGRRLGKRMKTVAAAVAKLEPAAI